LWTFINEKPRVEILYHSIHYLDLVRSYLGDPVKVYASTVKHPRFPELASTRTTMILDYNTFTQARIITNHGHDFGLQEQQSYLKIEGTKGAIKARIGVSLNYPAGVPDQFLFTSGETGGRWTEVRLLGSWFPDAFIGPMNHVQTMAQQSGIDRLATLRDNFATMRLVEAAYRSSESGGVRLDDIA
jgi:predicted dehydrogenase